VNHIDRAAGSALNGFAFNFARTDQRNPVFAQPTGQPAKRFEGVGLMWLDDYTDAFDRRLGHVFEELKGTRG
jgi:hypothetical protein